MERITERDTTFENPLIQNLLDQDREREDSEKLKGLERNHYFLYLKDRMYINGEPESYIEEEKGEVRWLFQDNSKRVTIPYHRIVTTRKISPDFRKTYIVTTTLGPDGALFTRYSPWRTYTISPEALRKELIFISEGTYYDNRMTLYKNDTIQKWIENIWILKQAWYYSTMEASRNDEYSLFSRALAFD